MTRQERAEQIDRKAEEWYTAFLLAGDLFLMKLYSEAEQEEEDNETAE